MYNNFRHRIFIHTHSRNVYTLYDSCKSALCICCCVRSTLYFVHTDYTQTLKISFSRVSRWDDSKNVQHYYCTFSIFLKIRKKGAHISQILRYFMAMAVLLLKDTCTVLSACCLLLLAWSAYPAINHHVRCFIRTTYVKITKLIIEHGYANICQNFNRQNHNSRCGTKRLHWQR